MKVACSKIQFRIDIDFEGCEVDMVLKERVSALCAESFVPAIFLDNSKIPIDESKLSRTPTENSVDFCLNWLFGFVDKKEMRVTNSRTAKCYRKEEDKTELEKIGVEVEEIYGLMQGTCHLICSCSPEIFSDELIDQSEEIIKNVFETFVVYYELAE